MPRCDGWVSPISRRRSSPSPSPVSRPTRRSRAARTRARYVVSGRWSRCSSARSSAPPSCSTRGWCGRSRSCRSRRSSRPRCTASFPTRARRPAMTVRPTHHIEAGARPTATPRRRPPRPARRQDASRRDRSGATPTTTDLNRLAPRAHQLGVHIGALAEQAAARETRWRRTARACARGAVSPR